MKRIHIIAVGRIRAPHWRAAAEEYQKRLGRVYRLEETIIKDGDASLGAEDRNAVEGERVLTALSGLPGKSSGSIVPIRLDETGRTLDSPAFSRYLEAYFTEGRTPCFLIGGAYGFSPAVRDSVREALALGPMTFPHELARVLLLEQLYRADAIYKGTPYHH